MFSSPAFLLLFIPTPPTAFERAMESPVCGALGLGRDKEEKCSGFCPIFFLY
jgi:hypothetical protein